MNDRSLGPVLLKELVICLGLPVMMNGVAAVLIGKMAPCPLLGRTPGARDCKSRMGMSGEVGHDPPLR